MKKRETTPSSISLDELNQPKELFQEIKDKISVVDGDKIIGYFVRTDYLESLENPSSKQYDYENLNQTIDDWFARNYEQLKPSLDYLKDK